MTRRLAFLRVFLGVAQMTGAATAAMLLITSGVNRISVGASVATFCLTGMSLLIFRGR